MLFTFSAISFLSSVLSIFIGNIVYFQSSKRPVHLSFFILCLFNAYWGFIEFLSRNAQSESDALFGLHLYSFVAMVIPVGFHFSLLYTRRALFLHKKVVLAAIYIPTLIISISFLFNNYLFDHVIKMPWGYSPVLAPSSIPRSIIILWLCIINSGSIVLVIYHLIKTHEPKEKKQAVLVAMGVIVPIVFANISIILLPTFKIQIPELTTVGTALQGIFIGFAIWKYDLFTLNPVTAAKNIVSTMSDLLILLSPSGKVVSINRAVTNLLNYQEKDLIRRPITDILSGKVAKHLLFIGAKSDKRQEITAPTGTTPLRNLEGILIAKDGQKIPTSVAVSTLRNRDHSLAGHVVITRDITEQKQIEAEREGLITELQDALSSIKVLRGLLPICSVCKKIRDDKGYWQQVDVYIRDHTEVDFSHSICEACAKELYPDIYEELSKGDAHKEKEEGS